MKNIGVAASVLQNTKRIVGSSDADWSLIRNGDYIKFPQELHLHTIQEVHRQIYMIDADVIAPTLLRIEGDVGINIFTGDELNLFYKEYELLTVARIIKPGAKYRLNDVLYINHKAEHSHLYDTLRPLATLIVTGIDEKGGVTNIAMKDKGRYVITPDRILAPTGGHGTECLLEVEYIPINQSCLTERQVTHIKRVPPYQKSDIYLSNALPLGIKKCHVSLQKWEIILSEPYTGSDLINTSYDFVRDFTPYLRLPLLVKGGNATHILYNRAITQLDSEIFQLRNRIAELEKKQNTPNS